MATLLLRAVLVLSVQAGVVAQATWALMANTGPSPRGWHAMVYDSQRGTTVLFGGIDGPSAASVIGDTWEWNGTQWMLLNNAGPPRMQHAMAFDNQRNRIVLFGGSDSQLFHFLGDTWEWDGISWASVATTGPSGRAGHAMAYDSQRHRTVLFGGYGSGYLADTWEWDGTSWLQVSTSGPNARVAPAMVYDSLRGKTVLFGGLFYNINGSIYYGDTWEWDGTSWTQVASTGPQPRSALAMAYDSGRGKVVMQGGNAGAAVFDDTWEWDGSTWTQTASAAPTGRYEHAMAYDSIRSRTVLFGGSPSSPGHLGDTWELGTTPLATAFTFGQGCGNPPLQFVPLALPRLHTTAQASLTNVPSQVAYVALGWSRIAAGPFPLPYPLQPFGMPGCYLLQSAEASSQPVTFTGASTAVFNLPVPNWGGLAGLIVYAQGWAFAPGANPGQTVVSNGIGWIVGF